MAGQFILALALLINGAISDDLEDSRNVGIELQTQSKRKIYLALQKLLESNQIFKSLKSKVESIEGMRSEYKNTVLPADAELQKMRKKIEERIQSVSGSETQTCSLSALNGGGNCLKKINHNDLADINANIKKYNELFLEITPKLDRWSDETTAINSIFIMAQKMAHSSLEELGSSSQSYWDGTVLINLSEGRTKIEGFISFPLNLDDEKNIKSILKERCGGYKVNIRGIENGLEELVNVRSRIDQYSPGQLLIKIDLITGFIHSIAVFGVGSSENSVDTSGLFYELLKYYVKKENV